MAAHEVLGLAAAIGREANGLVLVLGDEPLAGHALDGLGDCRNGGVDALGEPCADDPLAVLLHHVDLLEIVLDDRGGHGCFPATIAPGIALSAVLFLSCWAR